ncbi:integrase core domain-containing protein [Hymenobacter sp. NST-14]|nr:integrase core domain-containing protein [Hymenobacter piscis]
MDKQFRCDAAYRAAAQRLAEQSRRGECYGNAQAENRKSRLKTEVLELCEWPMFAALADAQTSAAGYSDYYSYARLHAGIGYQISYHAHQQLLQFSVLNYPA